DTFGQDLACGKVYDGRQIPDGAPILKAAQVTAPHLMRLSDRQIARQVVIAVMGCGNGAVSFNPSSRWTQIVLRHHPLRPFVVDAQMKRHTAMAVRWMLTMHRLNLLLECLVFSGLLQLAIDVLATDAQRFSTHRLDPGMSH